MPPVRRLRCLPHRRLLDEPMNPVDVPHQDHVTATGRCICGDDWTITASMRDLNYYKECHTNGREEAYWNGVYSEPEKIIKMTDDGEQNPSRWYFVTFTRDDKSDDPTQIIKNIKKVVKSKMVGAISWCYCIELTEKGIPHAHAAVFTEKYPESYKVGKFNLSPVGDQWIYQFKMEKWNVKSYVQKYRTKPDEKYLQKYHLNFSDVLVYSDNFPENLRIIYENPLDENIISHV